MDLTIVILAESYLKDIKVGYLFLSKKVLAKNLSVFAIRKNFEYCVHKLNKKLYVVNALIRFVCGN